MDSLKDRLPLIFSTEKGESIYSRVLEYSDKHFMTEQLHGGVLVGFSGGADSCLLLLFLCEYRRRTGKDIKIVACHINHMIRGDEADGDARFAKEFSDALGVEFILTSIDVPLIARKARKGLEETARNERYSYFNSLISGRNDINCVAVAHNATDNLETVLFNMMRGAGLNGISGIKPQRGKLLRPLLSLSSGEIRELLDEARIKYKFDSTNDNTDYTRNYIRKELLPLLKRLNPSPEDAVTRMSSSLLFDLEYFEKKTDEALLAARINTNEYSVRALESLPEPIFVRVLMRMAKERGSVYPEEKHIKKISGLISGGPFRYSLPGEFDIFSDGNICSFKKKGDAESVCRSVYPLKLGLNKLYGTNLSVYIGDANKISLNVYNFSINTSLSSAIIDDGMFIRFRNNGDSYTYSGITHKLKKVFNDRNIPTEERDLIPILCDKDGILWVPGLRPRDGAGKDSGDITLDVVFLYESTKEGELSLTTAKPR